MSEFKAYCSFGFWKGALVARKKHRAAQVTFAGFSTSHRNEYVEWITEAKGADTRARRIEQTIEWVAEGKSRNWKYEKR